MSNAVKHEADRNGKSFISSYKSVVSGGLAGVVSRFVIAPMDVVKIRLQLQSHNANERSVEPKRVTYKGFLPTLKMILKQEGIPGLWKGNLPAELLYMTYGALQFFFYETSSSFLKENFPATPRSMTAVLSGAAAGGFATAGTYPLDLLRTRFAASGMRRVYNSLWHAMTSIGTAEGVRGYYRGLSTTLIQIIPNMGIFFGTYETSKRVLNDVSFLRGWTEAIAGVLAGATAKAGIYPLDTIRRRLQVQGTSRALYVHSNIPVYTDTMDCLTKIVTHEGLRGLYRGLWVSILKAAPASAVTMWTYEKSMSLLRKYE